MILLSLVRRFPEPPKRCIHCSCPHFKQKIGGYVCYGCRVFYDYGLAPWNHPYLHPDKGSTGNVTLKTGMPKPSGGKVIKR